jgi:hypothetical protein
MTKIGSLLMKKLLTLCAVLACSLASFAQTSGVSMIVEAYGQTHYDEMLISNPGQIELLEKYATSGFKLVPFDDKYSSFPELTEISLRSKTDVTITVQAFLAEYDGGNFNPLNYRFFPGNEPQVYRLQGSSRVIYIPSQQSILAQ